jgi:6-pyruvoyltetrahydropterin/6-carboxytetrahydropterin synthase
MMRYDVSQKFFFEAAHTLDRDIETEAGKRVHGHTYHAEVTVSGQPDPRTGMLIDLGHLRQLIEHIRDRVDHRMLNEVEGLGIPTLENLCAYLWRQFEASGCHLQRVAVRREASGDSCVLSRVK